MLSKRSQWNAISSVSKFNSQLERIANKSLIKVYGHLLGMIIKNRRAQFFFFVIQMKNNQSYDCRFDMWNWADFFFPRMCTICSCWKVNNMVLRKYEIPWRKQRADMVTVNKLTLRSDDFSANKEIVWRSHSFKKLKRLQWLYNTTHLAVAFINRHNINRKLLNKQLNSFFLFYQRIALDINKYCVAIRSILSSRAILL